MNIATNLCSFALNQAANIVDYALGSPENKTKKVGEKVERKDRRQQTCQPVRQRRAVRLEVKGRCDKSWIIKCQQRQQQLLQNANRLRRNSFGKRQRKVTLLPTILEEECPVPENDDLNSDLTEMKLCGDNDPRWETRLGSSRDKMSNLARCASRA